MRESAQQEAIRLRLAGLASALAELADYDAGVMESAPRQGDGSRQRQLAAWGRAVAGVGRRNADRLRDGDIRGLESPPPHPFRH